MKRLIFSSGCLVLSLGLAAQSPAISEGNKLYREGRFDAALEAYKKALDKQPDNATAAYNRSTALAKKGDKEAAMKGYEDLLATTKEPAVLQRAYYSKGVLHQQSQQLDESIAAWKAALKLDPDDKETRENLEKALREKKQQEQQKQQQQKQQQNKKDQEKPKPEPQNKLNQKEVEQLLKALEQREKEVQKKLQQREASSSQPEKDW